MNHDPHRAWLDLGDSDHIHLSGTRAGFEQLREALGVALDGDVGTAVTVGTGSLEIEIVEIVVEAPSLPVHPVRGMLGILTEAISAIAFLSFFLGLLLCAIVGFFHLTNLILK